MECTHADGSKHTIAWRTYSVDMTCSPCEVVVPAGNIVYGCDTDGHGMCYRCTKTLYAGVPEVDMFEDGNAVGRAEHEAHRRMDMLFTMNNMWEQVSDMQEVIHDTDMHIQTLPPRGIDARADVERDACTRAIVLRGAWLTLFNRMCEIQSADGFSMRTEKIAIAMKAICDRIDKEWEAFTKWCIDTPYDDEYEGGVEAMGKEKYIGKPAYEFDPNGDAMMITFGIRDDKYCEYAVNRWNDGEDVLCNKRAYNVIVITTKDGAATVHFMCDKHKEECITSEDMPVEVESGVDTSESIPVDHDVVDEERRHRAHMRKAGVFPAMLEDSALYHLAAHDRAGNALYKSHMRGCQPEYKLARANGAVENWTNYGRNNTARPAPVGRWAWKDGMREW